MTSSARPAREPAWKLVLRAAAKVPLLGLLFLGAGRLAWPRGWLLCALIVGGILLNHALMLWKNPALSRARLEKHDNVEPWDKVFFAVSIPLSLAFLLVAGLDDRFGWSRLDPSWLWVGLLLHLAGTIPVALASITNPFMELAVRLQHDRGQVVVRDGPYRFVRHPMYTGLLLMFTGWPLVVGSLWGYLPIGALIIAYVVRTSLEDRTLRANLPGYEAYAGLTRYRLVPGLW